MIRLSRSFYMHTNSIDIKPQMVYNIIIEQSSNQTIEVTLGEKAYEEESSENTQQNRNNNLPNGSYFFGDNDDFFGMG